MTQITGNVLVNATSLYDTANEIRSKLGVQTAYLPSEFASAIASITGSGSNGSNGSFLRGTDEPSASLGNDGDLYFKYRDSPDGYTVVEYIEATGTQYIDTGVPARVELKAIIDCKWNSTGDQTVLGGSSNINTNAIYLGYNSSNTKTYVGYAGSWHDFNTGAVDQLRHLWEIDLKSSQQTITVDGSIKATTANIFTETTSTSTLYLFSRSNGNANFIGRIYGVQIYDNLDSENMIRDFIPCVRNSDDVAGMYDLVNNVFYTNDGTGDFVTGESAAIDNDLILAAYVKVNGTWVNLIGADVDDPKAPSGGGGGAFELINPFANDEITTLYPVKVAFDSKTVTNSVGNIVGSVAGDNSREGFNIQLDNLEVGKSYKVSFDYQLTSGAFLESGYSYGYSIASSPVSVYALSGGAQYAFVEDLAKHSYQVWFTPTATTMYLVIYFVDVTNANHTFELSDLRIEWFNEDGSSDDNAKNILSGTDIPTSADGNDGDIYLQYGMEHIDATTFSSINESSMSFSKNSLELVFAYDSGPAIGAQAYISIDLTNINSIVFTANIGTKHYGRDTPRFNPLVFIEDTVNPASNYVSNTLTGTSAQVWVGGDSETTEDVVIDTSQYNGTYWLVFNGTGCTVTYSEIIAVTGSKLIGKSYLKVNGSWLPLTGQDIDNVNIEGGGTNDTFAFIRSRYQEDNAKIATNGTITLQPTIAGNEVVFAVPTPSETPERWTVSDSRGASYYGDVSFYGQSILIGIELNTLKSMFKDTGYMLLSSRVGDIMQSGGRAFTRTTDEPIVFINQGNSSSSSYWGYAAITTSSTMPSGTYNSNGQITSLGRMVTVKGNTLYVYIMQAQWTNTNISYNVDGVESIIPRDKDNGLYFDAITMQLSGDSDIVAVANELLDYYYELVTESSN